MSHKPGILSLLAGIGAFLGVLALFLPAQWTAVAASTWRSVQPEPLTPDAPLAPACTNCHSNLGFDANSHHVKSGVDDADCQICHPETSNNAYHDNGSVQLIDPDSGAISTVTRIRGNRADLTAGDIAILDTFCQNCHDGDGALRLGANAHNPFLDGTTVISATGTHSNQGFSGVEADFYVGCIQCHVSHGSSNLAIIASSVVITPGVTGGPVTFTSETGANSRDDGTGNGICVICHANSNNPGHPMVNHNGGQHTRSDIGNKLGTDCSTCHSHEPDNNTATLNGHMPAGPNAVGLYGMLAQSGVWPVLGLVGVLCVVIIERRKHR